ncbi:MAG: chloramphenicol acetyltransferase [Flavobacteriaceae bacterium]|nr:chloramphenicol acetyltransferase [Flavobacteriaceae bacterium]
MKKKIDLETWSRKDHFQFFSQFEEPYHSITVEVDCTRTYHESKEKGYSLFLSYLHKSLIAANAVPAFRLRILDGEVYEFDTINASPTIPRPDGTFGFSYIDFHPDFSIFQERAKEVIVKVEKSTGLDPATSGQNVIHYSSLPWLKFTSLSHARSYSFPDSCPKISFGKMTELNGKRVMPMSVHAHHGLVDGRHVGEYVKILEEIL